MRYETVTLDPEIDLGGLPSSTSRALLSRKEFDPVACLALNPDVAAAGVDAYQHYLEFGYAEGRRTS